MSTRRNFAHAGSVRWIIRDPKTGAQVAVPHPVNDDERETLSRIVHYVRA